MRNGSYMPRLLVVSLLGVFAVAATTSHAGIRMPPKPSTDQVVAKPVFNKSGKRMRGSQIRSLQSQKPLDLPSASFLFTDAKGVTTSLELRCVHGRLADEPYYCEVTRRLQGVEMGSHAIYPKQLQSIFARFWMERGEAAGAYPPYDDKASLKWDWKFFEQSETGADGVVFNIPILRRDAGLILSDTPTDAAAADPALNPNSPSEQRNQARAAYWLFGVLRAWSNFSG